MNISPQRYHFVRDLLGRIVRCSGDQRLRNDANLVRNAMSLHRNHPAKVMDGMDVIEALARVVDGSCRYYEAFDLVMPVRGSLDDPDGLVQAVLDLRPKDGARGKNGLIKPFEIYSLGMFLLTLYVTKGIPGRRQPYVGKRADRRTVDFEARALNLFKRSDILQGVDDSFYATPEALVSRLMELRDEIGREQAGRRDRRFRDRGWHAMSSLTQALIAGRPEMFGRRATTYAMLAATMDMFNRSETLRTIPDLVLQDDGSLMRHIISRRDRITLEQIEGGRVKRANGDEANLVSLKSCVNALRMGGLITKKRAEHFNNVETSSIEHFLKRRHVLEPEVRKVMAAGAKHDVLAIVDREKFISMKGQKPLRDEQTRRIIRAARKFLSGPPVVTRSIYGAQDLAVLARAPHFIPSMPDLIPDEIGRDLDEAAREAKRDPHGARMRAVIALAGLSERYSAHMDQDNELGRYARGINRLFDWNSDALSMARAPAMPIQFISSTMTFVARPPMLM